VIPAGAADGCGIRVRQGGKGCPSVGQVPGEGAAPAGQHSVAAFGVLIPGLRHFLAASRSGRPSAAPVASVTVPGSRCLRRRQGGSSQHMLIRAVLPYGLGTTAATQTWHQQRRHLREPAGCRPRGAGRPQTRHLRDLARRAGPARAVAPAPRRPCGARCPRSRVGGPRHLSRSLVRLVSDYACGPTLGTSARVSVPPGVVESAGSIQTHSSPEHERQDPNAIPTDGLPLSTLFQREAVRVDSLLFPPDGTQSRTSIGSSHTEDSHCHPHTGLARHLWSARASLRQSGHKIATWMGARQRPRHDRCPSHPSH